jgi:cyclic pyranopterin phosphate synthase
MAKLTHLTDDGAVRMVDVTDKPVTHREAEAEGEIQMLPETLALIREGGIQKGNVLATARLAGIMAAKRTAEWIPLCHTLALTGVEVTFELDPDRIRVRSCVRVGDRTGVEMEALTAVSAALLTLYDMCKAADRGMVLGGIRLLRKTGGRSGTYEAPSKGES